MDSENDELLLEKLRKGDPQALDPLLRAYGDRLFGLAYSLLGRRPEHRSDAEDLVQETLLGALKSAKNFEGRSSLNTWLSRILANQVHAFRRSRRVRRTEALPESLGSTGVSSDARMDVEVMLAGLSDEHREIIVLRELEGHSYDEIAEILGVPRGTVESRLHRARGALREKFGAGDGR